MPLVVIGTSASPLQASASLPGHIQIRADSDNTATIYVAARSNVTTDSAAATCGMPLDAGESFLIPSYHQRDASQIYAISTAAGQNLFYEVITGP